MANTPEQRISEGRTFFIGRSPTEAMRVPEGRAFTVFNIPTISEQISQVSVTAIAEVDGTMEISEVRQFALVTGREADPRLRVWTATLDGHDFVVLRLGDQSTLVYDMASEQWVDWDSPGLPIWRLSTGINWIGAEIQSPVYGSNIVVGDDTFGVLWFLDPEQPFDQHPDIDNPVQALAFERVVTGQVLATGRQNLPCYTIFLDGDNYGVQSVDFTATVVLSTSDDQGRTFDDHDTITVTLENADQDYAWYSLGQIASPGRIFRITDNGVFTRIDAMSMNDA